MLKVCGMVCMRVIEIVHDLIESENKDMKDYLSNNLLARMSMEKV